MPKQETLTEGLADRVYRECGSQLPDETKLADLHIINGVTPASWASLLEKLTRLQRNVITNALGAAVRGYQDRWGREQVRTDTLGALRRGLPQYIKGLGPKRTAFLQRAFGTASVGETADAHALAGQPKSVGQYLDTILYGEGLTEPEQAALKELLIPHVLGLARLIKQMRSGLLS